MPHLPVIVGFGGVNPAGRLSMHHAYRRLVLDSLPSALQDSTFASLAGLMGIDSPESDAARARMRRHTLIRKIEHWDPKSFASHRPMELCPAEGESFTFTTRRRSLPRICRHHVLRKLQQLAARGEALVWRPQAG